MGSVRAAADKLNVAPSAVSRQITLLEQELASKLLERDKKGVKATEAGDLVLRFYRESVSSEENCISQLQALRGFQRGHINLAAGEGFVSDLMPPISDFNAQYPSLTLSIDVAGSNEVIRQVEEDEAHLGLLFHPTRHPRIRSQVVSLQPICAIVASDHPLAKNKQPVTLTQLLEYPVALQEARFGVRQLLAMAEFHERIRFQPTITTNSILALKQFVRNTQGFTFLPAFVVAQEISDGHLVAVTIEHEILSQGECHLVTRLGRQLSEGPRLLLQHLTSWMKAFDSSSRLR